MPEKLPPLEVQQRIVDKIEPERKVVASLREMVKTYEEKIKRVIDSVWGSETLCFSVPSVVIIFLTTENTEIHGENI